MASIPMSSALGTSVSFHDTLAASFTGASDSQFTANEWSRKSLLYPRLAARVWAAANAAANPWDAACAICSGVTPDVSARTGADGAGACCCCACCWIFASSSVMRCYCWAMICASSVACCRVSASCLRSVASSLPMGAR